MGFGLPEASILECQIWLYVKLWWGQNNTPNPRKSWENFTTPNQLERVCASLYFGIIPHLHVGVSLMYLPLCIWNVVPLRILSVALIPFRCGVFAIHTVHLTMASVPFDLCWSPDFCAYLGSFIIPLRLELSVGWATSTIDESFCLFVFYVDCKMWFILYVYSTFWHVVQSLHSLLHSICHQLVLDFTPPTVKRFELANRQG